MTLAARNTIAIVICGVLLIAFGSMAWLASLGKSATVDEPGNLVSGWTQVQYGDFRFNCEDPALFKTIVGLGLPADLFHIDRQSPQWQSLLVNADQRAPLAVQALYHTPGLDADAVLRAEHFRMTFIGMLLGIVIAWWAWRLAGPVAAIFATAAFCFDPNFLAHAPLVKNDVLQALPLVLFAAAVWMFGERATLVRFAAICLFMALAILVKFSGFLTLPILALSLLARSFIPLPWPIGKFIASNLKKRLTFSTAVFLGSVALMWFAIWAGYNFRFLPDRNSSAQYDWVDPLKYYANHAAFAESAHPFAMTSDEIENFRAHWHSPLGARVILFANAHHLFPQSYLVGLLRIIADSQSRTAFLCGKSSVAGWWYYFPLAMLFKTPAATLVGLLGVCAILLPRLRRFSLTNAWPLTAAALLPIVWMAVAMHSNVNVGIRHILPVYPALFIFLGVAAAAAFNSAKRPARFAVGILAISLAAESVLAFPNFIPFFNVFVGGYRGGFHLLSESNLDWGQDLPALAAWQSENRNRPLYLMYWGSADPRYYGIHYVNLPGSNAGPDETAPGPGQPVFAISAVVLTNPFSLSSQKDFFDSIFRKPPIAILNGSIYVYDSP